MKQEQLKSKVNWNLLVGWTLIFIDILWIWDNLSRLYFQHFGGGVLYLFHYPDWILILNSVFGIVGLFIGYNVVKTCLKITLGIFLNLIALLSGGLLKYIIMI